MKPHSQSLLFWFTFTSLFLSTLNTSLAGAGAAPFWVVAILSSLAAATSGAVLFLRNDDLKKDRASRQAPPKEKALPLNNLMDV